MSGCQDKVGNIPNDAKLKGIIYFTRSNFVVITGFLFTFLQMPKALFPTTSRNCIVNSVPTGEHDTAHDIHERAKTWL